MFAAAGVGEAVLGGLCDKQVRASGFQDDGVLGEEVVDGGNWSGRRIDQRSRRARFETGAEEKRGVAGGRRHVRVVGEFDCGQVSEPVGLVVRESTPQHLFQSADGAFGLSVSLLVVCGACGANGGSQSGEQSGPEAGEEARVAVGDERERKTNETEDVADVQDRDASGRCGRVRWDAYDSFREAVNDDHERVVAFWSLGERENEVKRDGLPSLGRDGQRVEEAGWSLGRFLGPLAGVAGVAEAGNVSAETRPVEVGLKALEGGGGREVTGDWEVMELGDQCRAEWREVRDAEAAFVLEK